MLYDKANTPKRLSQTRCIKPSHHRHKVLLSIYSVTFINPSTGVPHRPPPQPQPQPQPQPSASSISSRFICLNPYPEIYRYWSLVVFGRSLEHGIFR
ncbi:hypothetical protein L6452_39970 [Arctium lappa]|uniref:Uncharacterized protein n=1 Tax=Arctium lappa TaxID=4217 RepID=A0ACB8XTR6_ARCLA|nr:hypothetical protein L6452_39970 [Arctium lappa]